MQSNLTQRELKNATKHTKNEAEYKRIFCHMKVSLKRNGQHKTLPSHSFLAFVLALLRSYTVDKFNYFKF